MKLDGAILDIDGTILDSMPVWHNCGERVLHKMGIRAEAGLGSKLFAMTSITSAEYMIEKYDLPHTVDEMRELLNDEMASFYQTEADFKPGALHFLKELRARGIPSVVVTSTDIELIMTAFARIGIDEWFVDILSSGSLDTSKGEPHIWKQATDLLRQRGAGDEIYAFDDGLYAIRTAKTVGLKTVGIYDGVSAAHEEEMRGEADLYLYSIGDFPF